MVVTAFRCLLRPGDAAGVGELVRATGFFSAEEADVAVELAEDGVTHGAGSHYQFELAEHGRHLAGYACFGRVPATVWSWDLYWICVHPEHQGRGLGSALLERVEQRVVGAGGGRIYADTSSREQYQPTRRFYERCGYSEVAALPDFYGPGDGKVIYLKVV
jgi:GNAT superfamily N-acetyltransferase